MLTTVGLVLSLLALGYAVLHDANNRHRARHATRISPAQTRPGWGEGSRIPEGAFSIHDYEN